MLEQAILAAAVTALTAGSIFDGLVATPDGGASVAIERGVGYAIGHVRPDGRFTTTEFREFVGRPTVGPDANAWFPVGQRLARVETTGAISTLGPFGGEDHRISHGLVTGPDGNLWGPTSIGHNLARISPSGEASFSHLGLSRCSSTDILPHDAERAADGTVWFTDWICEQLVRVAPNGAPTQIDVDAEPIALARDTAGGMWFAAQQGRAGHVDAAGQVRHFDVQGATDVAVAPDGAAWFANHTCDLARVTPAGKITRRPAPIPAVYLAFDPTGVPWFASYKRLVHGTASRPCEDRVRKLTLPRRISFATLRRDGVRIAGSERAFVERRVIFRYGRRPATFAGGSFVVSAGASYRYRPRPEQIRKIRRFLAKGERVVLDFRLDVTNAEIMHGETWARVRVTR